VDELIDIVTNDQMHQLSHYGWTMSQRMSMNSLLNKKSIEMCNWQSCNKINYFGFFIVATQLFRHFFYSMT
jgi:hypothetical protein